MKKSITILVLFISLSFSFSQESEDFSKRLKAINNLTITFYNIDGADFSSETFSNPFSEEGLKKIYKKYSIKEEDVKVKDDSLNFNNLLVTKSEKVTDEFNQISSYYFVENKNKTITVIWFGSFTKPDKKFERKYVNHIIKDEIPKEVFESKTIGTIDFAGRKLELNDSCYWTNVNTVQCPYNGEMNWSVHKTFESSKYSIDTQFNLTKSKKGGKIISEEEVNVVFEGTDTKAKKVVYDFTGAKSVLAGMSGAKTLTIYYVSCKVRENYVSCCMSFWNNDNKTESGLAPLLEKVMQLK